jgi:hypothetical protein
MVVAGFGGKGDTPIVGDWGATGRDEIGVFRDGFWILDYNGNFQWDGTGTGKDIVAGFGKAGDVPVAADLNGDGFPEIAVFRPSAGQLIIDLNGNFRWDGTGQRQDTVVNLGQSGDLEVRGDWDATEIENIGVFRNGFWILDYNGNHQWDGMPEDKAIGFGMFGDTPVSGNYAYAWHP